MSDHHDLAEIDVDGAIQETAERAGVDRGDLLKRDCWWAGVPSSAPPRCCAGFITG